MFRLRGLPYAHGVACRRRREARAAELLETAIYGEAAAHQCASNARKLGRGIISVIVDHASQLEHLNHFFENAGFAAGVYLKVDTGYHRAGLPPSGINKDELVAKVMELETQGIVDFFGLYSHSSLSYNDSTPERAMTNLEGEINGCLEALERNASLFSMGRTITISVGASPQVTAVENLMAPETALSKDAKHLQETLQRVMTERPNGFQIKLELHAGVYPVLDIQQLSTHSRSNLGEYEDEIALSVMAEVCSVYNDGERAKPEALLAAGTLALGREPCPSYPGWGVLSHWRRGASVSSSRLIVERISQEHSIVAFEDSAEQ